MVKKSDVQKKNRGRGEDLQNEFIRASSEGKYKFGDGKGVFRAEANGIWRLESKSKPCSCWGGVAIKMEEQGRFYGGEAQ